MLERYLDSEEKYKCNFTGEYVAMMAMISQEDRPRRVRYLRDKLKRFEAMSPEKSCTLTTSDLSEVTQVLVFEVSGKPFQAIYKTPIRFEGKGKKIDPKNFADWGKFVEKLASGDYLVN